MKNKTTKQNKPDSAILQQFFAVYPALKEDNDEWLELLGHAQIYTAEPQGRLCDEEKRFLLLLEGQVRVYQLAQDGREFTLYRNNPGEICVMSLSSILNNEPFRAHSIAETRLKALALPASDFFRALNVSQSFRLLVITSLTTSFNHMIDTFQETVFNRLEIRMTCLLSRLFERAQSDVLNITHMDIAHEMGTTREVVSRILKQMEQEGFLQLSRGKIKLVASQPLQGYVQ